MSAPQYMPMALDPTERPAICQLVEQTTGRPPPMTLNGYKIRPRKLYLIRIESRTGSTDSWVMPPAVLNTPGFIEVVGDHRQLPGGIEYQVKAEPPGVRLAFLARVRARDVVPLRLQLKDGRHLDLDVPVVLSGYIWDLWAYFISGGVLGGLAGWLLVESHVLEIPQELAALLVGLVFALVCTLGYIAYKTFVLSPLRPANGSVDAPPARAPHRYLINRPTPGAAREGALFPPLRQPTRAATASSRPGGRKTLRITPRATEASSV